MSALNLMMNLQTKWVPSLEKLEEGVTVERFSEID